MPRITRVSGGDGITFSDDLSQGILAVLRSAQNASSATLISTIKDVASVAESQIPVKTGKLRDSLATSVSVGESQVKATIGLGSSTVDYAYYVKYSEKSSLNPKKSVWQEAVRKPALKAAENIASKMASEFASQASKNRVR